MNWRKFFFVLFFIFSIAIFSPVNAAGEVMASYGFDETEDAEILPALELAVKGNLFDYLSNLESCWTEPLILRPYGKKALASGDKLFLETALSLLKKSFPGNGKALLLAGYISVVLELPEAEDYFLRAAESSNAGKLGLSYWLLNEGKAEEAFEVLGDIKEDKQMAGKIIYFRGLASCLAGRYLQANLAWQSLPYQQKIHYAKDYAKLLFVLGQYKKAQQVLADGLVLEPSNILLLDLKGIFSWYNGESYTALWQWKKIVEKYPQYPFTYVNLVWGYLEKNDLTSALYYYNKGEKVLTGHKDNLNLVFGQKYEEKGLDELAEEKYKLALTINDKNPITYLLLGTLLIKKKNLAEAEDVLNKGISIFPNFAPLYRERAKVYNSLSDSRQEKNDLEFYQQAEVLAGNDELYIELDPYLYGGKGEIGINIKGRLADANRGTWISADGIKWQWYPWYGWPPRFKSSSPIDELWIYPCIFGFQEVFKCRFVAPLSGRLLINNGATKTDQAVVSMSLDINQTDKSNLYVAFREAGGQWSKWFTWRDSYLWTLSSGSGKKIIEA